MNKTPNPQNQATRGDRPRFSIIKEEGEQVKIEAKRTYSMTYLGYDILLVQSDNRSAELSIYPTGGNRIRMGLFHCHPRFVAELEKFAVESEQVLSAAARAMRSAGLDDLRDKFERMSDDFLNSLPVPDAQQSPTLSRENED